MKIQYALIVDVAVSGNSLAYEFVSRGYRVINIYSSKKTFQKLFKSLNNSIYETCLIYESDEQLRADLEKYNIMCCLPGSDYGIPVSNHINEMFGFGVDNKIITDRYKIPTILYKYNNDTKYYFPDIYIPHKNLIIEVKSDWIYKKQLDRNIAKEEATQLLGYNYQIWFFNKKGAKISPHLSPHPSLNLKPEYSIKTQSHQ